MKSPKWQAMGSIRTPASTMPFFDDNITAGSIWELCVKPEATKASSFPDLSTATRVEQDFPSPNVFLSVDDCPTFGRRNLLVDMSSSSASSTPTLEAEGTQDKAVPFTATVPTGTKRKRHIRNKDPSKSQELDRKAELARQARERKKLVDISSSSGSEGDSTSSSTPTLEAEGTQDKAVPFTATVPTGTKRKRHIRNKDPNKRQRLDRKAELARQARERKKQYVTELEIKVNTLQKQIVELQRSAALSSISLGQANGPGGGGTTSLRQSDLARLGQAVLNAHMVSFSQNKLC